MPDNVGHNAFHRTVIEDNTVYSHTVFYDDDSLAKNARIRSSGMLEQAKLALHNDEDVRMVFSIPSNLQYTIFKKKYPDIYASLMSQDESERMKGAKQMQLLHPDWVVMERL